MNKKIFTLFIIFSLFCNFTSPLFCEDTTPVPYDDKEFPQTLKDLRRFEIITLGSLPFVTLDTTLVYSSVRYAQHNFDNAYQPDIFNKANYTQDEQTGIILTSVGICIGIGLTDLLVQVIKRSSKKRRARQLTYDDISIVPISEDPDAVELPLPQKNTDSEKVIDSTEEVQEIEE